MFELDKLPHPSYLPYPNKYTSAFFTNNKDAQDAVNELLNEGFTMDDFFVFQGPQGLNAIDAEGVHHNLLARYMRQFIKFSASAEWDFLSSADQNLREGHLLICVLTPTEQDKDEVVSCFQGKGGYDIKHFTPMYIEDVE
ncbi:hypothetical protein BDW_01390 [Bdellovibrio bacteriovorus W]|nr:hypothetical protein BDW_01390 [Bdellovibrio bacteriovorus W]